MATIKGPIYNVRPATDTEMRQAPLPIDPATVGGNQKVMVVVSGPYNAKRDAKHFKVRGETTVVLLSHNATVGHVYRSGS